MKENGMNLLIFSLFLLGLLILISEMVKVYKSGLMVLVMRVTGKIIKPMEEVD